MKFHWDNKYFHWGLTLFFVIAASILFYFSIFHLGNFFDIIKKILKIIMPVIYGAAIAYLINPLLRRYEKSLIYPVLEKKNVNITKRRRKIIRYSGVFLSEAVLLWVVYALLSMILPELIKSIVNIINNFPFYVNSARNWIAHILENNQDINGLVLGLIDNYSQRAETYLTHDILPQLQNILRHFSTGLVGVFVFLKNLLIGVIVSIYILIDKETFRGRMKKALYAAVSEKPADLIMEYLRLTDRTFGAFIGGKLLDSLIIGILCYIGTTILKMPYAILVSVVVGVTNVIPFFGPYLGAIPSAFLILLVSPIKCLYFVIFILVLQQFDGNILGPKILGNSTGLSSFMVILAILIGGGLFGIVGMFVGVPIFAIIYAVMNRIIDRTLQRKNMPTDVEKYL